ncbi:hypothetical protein [Kitasatospora sp. Root107]|uniref:hypothetical protein n=1 Tax=Kitasatospora sp. Root107 TaxID=1736424 RepID=UPI00070C952A|nr:hypothetical protein [Kitasatospora sp. Root107]KQV16617.1 hypothetical protein ASC99_27990 [Kitasatospora sp. Root107]
MTAPRTWPTSTVPLYEHALRLHRLDPDGPLPGFESLPDRERHLRAERQRRCYRDSKEARLRGARTAAVIGRRLDRPLSPASLRLLASALAQVSVPSSPDPAIQDLTKRHPPELLRTVGRWLTRHGTERDVVFAGLALLAETATERDIPMIQTIGLLGSPFAVLPAHALERLPAPTPALTWLADRTTGTGRIHCIHALNRLADPGARYPWYRNGHDPYASPDRPADPQAVHWLRRRAVDLGDFNGYFAAQTVIAAAVDQAIADPHADSEVVDQTGRLLRTMTDCFGMGATLASLDNAHELLAHYADHVSRLRPTVDRYESVLQLAAYLADPHGEAAGLGWAPGRQAALQGQLTTLLRRPGWPTFLEELMAWPTGNIGRWATLLARRVGLLPTEP